MFQRISMEKTQKNQQSKDTIVLGLNGWNYHGHDASACLIKNGKVLSFVEEERFNRQRYAFDAWPIEAIQYCLATHKLEPQDITQIAFGWNTPKRYALASLPEPYTNLELLQLLFPKKMYPQLNHEQLPMPEMIDHHLAHAASSAYVSGFNEATVLVLDGQGEDASGWLGTYKDDSLTPIRTIPTAFSLGYFMSAICVFLGLRTHDAGKLMGLAAHGQAKYEFPEFVLDEESYQVPELPVLRQRFDHQTPVVDAWLAILRQRFPQHKPKFSCNYDPLRGKTVSQLELDEFSKDLAASAQKALETVILHIVRNLTAETGIRKLVYSGGVALNCTTNGRLLAEKYVDDLYVQPAANDAGVSLGAAILASQRVIPHKMEPMDHCYWGAEYSNAEIESELKRLKIAYIKETGVTKKAAMALSHGKVIAWFQGKMEVGPRALGNRSILSNPAIKEMHHLLNVIKSREQWRPLAPSVLEEDIELLFENARISPFMLLTHSVKKEWQDKIPAVVHVDGTTRYQSVSRKYNPKYHQLISEFKEITGLPIVMNTSFNTGGEPIVMTPEQAIKTFFTSEIDILVLNDFWIEK